MTNPLLLAWIIVANTFAAFFLAPIWWPLALLEAFGYMNRHKPEKWNVLPQNFILVLARLASAVMPVTVINKAGNLKSKKIIFVANHQLFAMDCFGLWNAIINGTQIYPRGLVDRFHYYLPVWDRIVMAMGGILADKEQCVRAMDNNLPLLVFPGGANEGFRSGDRPPYSLHWGNRKGFARLAARKGYTIVPISSIGIDDNFKILYHIPMYRLFKLLGDNRPSNFTVPIFVWNPFAMQRQYVLIGEPIPADGLADFGACEEEDIYIEQVREKSKLAIEAGFESLKRFREADKSRYLLKSN
jgi:1-acyl-sn-glycerol-3-phosphate acyltransferase